jgi:hypothetical protein
MSEKTHMGISSATEWTQSNSSSATARERMSRASPRIRSS